jgi:hypothetical protein
MSLPKPDILQDVGLMPTDQSVNVTTSILDPVVRTASMCRFVLENKGRLHGNSKITLGITAPSEEAYFPINLGVHALIQRVSLKFGAKVISEITDFHHWMAYKNCFIPNEQNFERNSITNGTLLDYRIVETDENDFDGLIGINTGRSYATNDGATPEAYNDLKNTPKYQIRLVDMFPFLGQIQLPLYLMKEQVAIEIYFEPTASKRYIIPKGGTDPASVSVNLDEIQMVADYIYYPQPIMDNYEAQMRTSGLTIPYLEYAMVKTTVARATMDAGFIRNIGGANRLVSKVVVMNAADAATDFGKVETLYNEFGSDCADAFELNIKYNDRFLYPRAITNFGHAFNQVHNAEGVPMFVTAAEYQQAIPKFMTDQEFLQYAQDDIAEKQRRTYFAMKLDGQRVNAAGIELHLKMTTTPRVVTSRIYLEQACVLTLRDGKMTKAFA